MPREDIDESLKGTNFLCLQGELVHAGPTCFRFSDHNFSTKLMLGFSSAHFFRQGYFAFTRFCGDNEKLKLVVAKFQRYNRALF